MSSLVRRCARAARRAVLPITFLVLGCFLGWAAAGDPPEEAELPPRSAQTDRSASGGGGQLRLVWRRADTSDARMLRAHGGIDAIADAVNESLELPGDVTVVMGGADDGPYYDPASRRIEYPWSFVRTTRDALGQAGYRSGGELDTAVAEATEFVVLHEVAHALIDVLDIPIVGREEDAADSFAAFVAVEAVDDGERTIAAADLFASLADGDFDEAAFWDSHSLDIQRFYQINCLVYGSDPDRHEGSVAGLDIDESRLDECGSDWEQVRDGWYDLLDDALVE